MLKSMSMRFTSSTFPLPTYSSSSSVIVIKSDNSFFVQPKSFKVYKEMGSEGHDGNVNPWMIKGGGDDAEWKKVNLMRAFVDDQDPHAKEVDNFMLRRFLRARDLDIERASAMLLKYLKWKREVIPSGLISCEQIQNELRQEKVFMQGLDKKGRPIAVVFGAKHYSSKRNIDELKSYVVYALDKLCARMPRGQEMFIGIGDLQGWGYSNCDIRGYLAVLEIMQNYYPERLGKAFLIHVPYLFMKAWKIVYPFMDKNTRKKFVFVEDKNLKSTLLEDIDESQLPEIYGGKLSLVPVDASDKPNLGAKSEDTRI